MVTWKSMEGKQKSELGVTLVGPGSPLKEGNEISASLVFLILSIFFLVHLLYAIWGPMNIMGGGLLGTDGYTRLNRVQFIYEQGTWNNSIYPRSNAPYGESIHWTKPMDFLLLAGAGAFSVFLPFSTGLHVWGVLISPLLHIVALAGLFYLMRQRFDRLGMILLAILFLSPPILTGYFMIGRPDHHSLILAIFSWFVVGLHWSLHTPQKLRSLVFIGCLGALGLWVSVEFLVPIGFFLSVYSLLWIWQGQAKVSPILIIMGSMLLFSALFLCVERLGEDLFLIEYDRISFPHEMVLGLILVVWMSISVIGRKSMWLSTAWTRMGILGAGSLIAASVQWYLFPGFFYGPLVDMDPAIRQLVWDHVAETQSLPLNEVIMNLGIGILTLPSLAYSMRPDQKMANKYQAIFFLIGAAIFIPLAVYESRWTPYASIILLIPYAVNVRSALEWVETRWPNRRGEAASLIFGLVLLFWPVTVGTVVAFAELKQEPLIIGGKCPLMPLAAYLKEHTSDEPTAKTILAFKDFGPELLYRTSLNVIATPMHRNREGLRAMLGIMRAKDSSTAETAIQERDIDLILICVNSTVESRVYQSSLGEENFYESLLNGNLPTEWLEEVILPEDLQKSFKLFEVKKS